MRPDRLQCPVTQDYRQSAVDRQIHEVGGKHGMEKTPGVLLVLPCWVGPERTAQDGRRPATAGRAGHQGTRPGRSRTTPSRASTATRIVPVPCGPLRQLKLATVVRAALDEVVGHAHPRRPQPRIAQMRPRSVRPVPLFRPRHRPPGFTGCLAPARRSTIGQEPTFRTPFLWREIFLWPLRKKSTLSASAKTDSTD